MGALAGSRRYSRVFLLRRLLAVHGSMEQNVQLPGFTLTRLEFLILFDNKVQGFRITNWAALFTVQFSFFYAT